MIREAAGLSLAEVAAACGADPSSVYRWETGERRPSGERAVRYAAVIAELRDRNSPRRRDVARP
jgi:transcriptional regulator with XRE-family HTH domain